jgi:hypothetical protein
VHGDSSERRAAAVGELRSLLTFEEGPAPTDERGKKPSADAVSNREKGRKDPTTRCRQDRTRRKAGRALDRG